jgi:hypothetical protein
MATTAPSAPTTSDNRPLDVEPVRVPLREGPRQQAIDAGTFRETMAFLRPKAEEMKWASIPWQTDLWEARRLAAETGKPIFMWAMNGNPLGCV